MKPYSIAVSLSVQCSIVFVRCFQMVCELDLIYNCIGRNFDEATAKLITRIYNIYILNKKWWLEGGGG